MCDFDCFHSCLIFTWAVLLIALDFIFAPFIILMHCCLGTFAPRYAKSVIQVYPAGSGKSKSATLDLSYAAHSCLSDASLCHGKMLPVLQHLPAVVHLAPQTPPVTIELRPTQPLAESNASARPFGTNPAYQHPVAMPRPAESTVTFN